MVKLSDKSIGNILGYTLVAGIGLGTIWSCNTVGNYMFSDTKNFQEESFREEIKTNRGYNHSKKIIDEAYDVMKNEDGNSSFSAEDILRGYQESKRIPMGKLEEYCSENKEE